MKKTLALILVLTVILSLAAVSVSAETYKPSIEQKAAPAPVEEKSPVEGAEDDYVAIWYDSNGRVKTYPNDEDGYKPSHKTEEHPTVWFVITPAAEENTTHYEEIKEMLDGALASVKAAASVGDLCADIAPALEAVKAASSDPAAKECTVDDLVVTDLFDASFVDDDSVQKLADGETMQFTVKTNLRPGDVYLVLHCIDTKAGKWEVLESDLANNGALTIRMSDSMSPVAIVVDALSANGGAGGTVISPRTEGEDAELIAPAPAEEEQKGFQWNRGSISGVLMVIFGIGIIIVGVTDSKKKQAAGKAKKPDPNSPLLRK